MSISANEIKRVRSLSDKKFRDRYGLFCVEGEKMVDEALRSGFDVETVYRKDEIGEETHNEKGYSYSKFWNYIYRDKNKEYYSY